MCCGPSPVSARLCPTLPLLPVPHLPRVPTSPAAAPGALTQAIRNFAKSLESWLTHAMVNIPEEMLRVKVRVVGTRGQQAHSFRSSLLVRGAGEPQPPLLTKAIRCVPMSPAPQSGLWVLSSQASFLRCPLLTKPICGISVCNPSS